MNVTDNFPSPMEYFCYSPEHKHKFLIYHKRKAKQNSSMQMIKEDLILARELWKALVLIKPLLATKKRTREISVYRAAYCNIIKANTKLGVKQIGDIMSLDHSSVIYAAEKCAILLEINDKQCIDIYAEVKDVFTDVEERLS